MIQKIAEITFICCLFVLIVGTAMLYIAKPEWFLYQQQKVGNIIQLDPVVNYDPTQPPHRTCIDNLSGGKSCYNFNLPYGKPYITQTPFAPLYNNQITIVIGIIAIALLLYRRRLATWIRTNSN